MEQVQAASRRLADRTSAQIRSLWARVKAGEIDVVRFRVLAAAVIARANAQGVTLADLGLVAEVARQTRRAVRPLGLTDPVATDQERIDRVITTAITATDSSPVEQLDRVARSEPLLTVANTVQAGMVAHGAGGWTRMLTGTSCPLCTRWADGVVRSSQIRMARHVGCDCIQAPVFTP